MEHLHSAVQAGPRESVQVALDKAARVLVMDSLNYSAYRSGRSFRYYGGWARVSPCRVTPPHSGQWHVVVDLEGRPGTIRAGISVVSMN